MASTCFHCKKSFGINTDNISRGYTKECSHPDGSWASEVFCSYPCFYKNEELYGHKTGSTIGRDGDVFHGSGGNETAKSAARWLEKAAGIKSGPTMGQAAERMLDEAGLGAVSGAAKLAGKAMAKEAAREAAEEAQREAIRKQKEAEKEAVKKHLKTLDFGKDPAAVADALNGSFEVLSYYSYDLDFPFGPKGPGGGVAEGQEYKKDIWKMAEKHIEEGIKKLEKLGGDPGDFSACLQAEQDRIDPKKVKERLLVEKEAEKQMRVEEKAQRKEEMAQAREDVKERFNAVKGLFGGSKNEEIQISAEEKEAEKQARAEEQVQKHEENKEKFNAFKEKAGGLLGGLKSGETADEAADKLKDGIGGLTGKLGGLFGKKK